MNLRDRQPRKTDQVNDDDDEDIVLKSEEPDESQATIENDREKVSDVASFKRLQRLES